MTIFRTRTIVFPLLNSKIYGPYLCKLHNFTDCLSILKFNLTVITVNISREGKVCNRSISTLFVSVQILYIFEKLCNTLKNNTVNRCMYRFTSGVISSF